MSVAWLPGWWGIAVCVVWGIVIGIVGTLMLQDWRIWVENDRGRHRGARKDEGRDDDSSERDLL